MKVIAKLFTTLIKTALALLILALLAPILYFAWRANQPMDMPEFKGLTLVQYEDWRKMIYEKNEDEFALAHPDRIVEQGGCFKRGLLSQAFVVSVAFGWLFSAFLNPITHEKTVSEIERFGGVDTAVWSIVESTAIWPIHNHVISKKYPWCDLNQAVPTPEQYEAMKQERANMTP